MANHLVKIHLDNGQELYVETPELHHTSNTQPALGLTPQSATGDRISAITHEALTKSFDAIKTLMSKLSSTLEDMQPDNIELQTSIKIAGEMGFVIAKTSTEANITLTLKWNKT